MRFIEVQALFCVVSEVDYESLGLPAPEEESIIKPMMVDLDRIESFSPSKKKGEDFDSATNFITHSGEEWTIMMTYQEFKDLLVPKIPVEIMSNNCV